jgi:hypothetical protein
MGRRASCVLAGMMLWLVCPAGAQAASKPGVSTGGAASITQSTATLTGAVDPNGAATTYFFQIGPTSLYGAQTAALPAGSGTKAGKVAVPVGALAPYTVYHYRLVASNAKGMTKGRDRTLRTLRQPLGLALGALPNPVAFGQPTTLTGTLTGTFNANRQVVLQGNPFPYTQGFVNVSNVQLTNAAGGFAFTLPSVGIDTQFRVLMPQRPAVASPIIFVGVAPLVTVHVRVRHTSRGPRLRFFGSVRPALVGVRITIQKRRHHRWRTIARALTHGVTATRASYRRRVRQRRGGRYRVLVEPAGNYVTAASRSVRVRVR